MRLLNLGAGRLADGFSGANFGCWVFLSGGHTYHVFSPIAYRKDLNRQSIIGEVSDPKETETEDIEDPPICTLDHPILEICSTCQSSAVYVIESHPPTMKCPHEKNPKEMVSSRKKHDFWEVFNMKKGRVCV